MARFCVCIPVYNGANFLAQALESIAAQTHRDVRVIVSDNASSDATPEILGQWSGKLDLRVVRRPETMPMRDHFNALLDEIDCDAYMVLCHDDYLARPDALELAQAALDAHPDVSAVYCDLVYVNENRRPLSRRRFGRSGRFTAREAGMQTLRSGRNCFGIPLAVRREALGALRYDPRFLYSMDVDLSWAISRERDAWHIAEPLIANRYTAQNTTWSLLDTARREYIALSQKHAAAPGGLERFRIALVCWWVGMQKRAFGLYARMVS